MPNDKDPLGIPDAAEYGLNIAYLTSVIGMTGVDARDLLGGATVNGRDRAEIAQDTIDNSRNLTKT